MINCIIVDEKPDVDQLGSLVAKCPSLNLVGTFNDPDSALDQLSKQRNIDLAFVDFRVVGKDNFERINNLDNAPDIIALASDGQHALMAFDNNCVDYLVKPVSFSRFFRALDKMFRFNSLKGINYTEDKVLFIRKDESLIRMNIKDIAYIEALENYIILNTSDKRFTIHFTMKGIESQLPSEVFARVHRSFIVNKRLIKTIDDCSLQIILGENHKIIPIGKSFRNMILNEICVMNPGER
ncbi:MAG: response regulator transcription factor [Bacteroidales bacterium]|nr:response regulator transcription factor [Bacteroidales bacterium]